MVSDNEQLKPTPFEPAPAAQPQQEARKAPPGWVWPALGGLLLLALLVVFWLPALVGDPAAVTASNDEGVENTAAATGTQAAANGQATAKPETGPDVSPWSDAQAAKLRKEAQDVLAQLLDIQFALEEREVERWAPEAYGEAGALATTGDELYRQRQYLEAKDNYQQSLAMLQSIQDSIPDTVNTLLQQARQGIERGDPAAVNEALELAALIEPENAELAALQQRAAKLEPLLELMAQAAQAEQAGDLAGAENNLREATTLDPQHQRAAAELARVSADHLARRFNDAMSDGYSALDEGQFNQARKHFNAAARLQSGSAEAASALQEVATAEQASTLTRLKSNGDRYEGSEQWQQALEAYEQALKIDANVAFASEGVERARFRARLDKQFRTAIAEPQRLSDVAVAEAVEKLLAQARNIEPAGPVLAQQVSQLETLLQQANTPVQVTLVSDGETEVIVYKIARLGRFQQRELTLRPGTYTARGSRNGYRDVLEKFTITHKGLSTPITIACRESIN
jgi:tetratricopeptide (TPR) repeat protein